MSTSQKSTGPVIEVRDLQFAYGAHTAVRGVSLRVERGDIFALLGTNGAGKTTTLELIQGFRQADSGHIRVMGVDPRTDQGTIRRRTGAMLQEAGLFPELTVTGTMRLWADLSSRTDDVQSILERVGLGHKQSTRVQSLSGGERRRLDLAMTIWGSPDLIILDEPTTGLDPASRQTLWSLIQQLRENGTTVVLTTHQLEEAESLADRVAIMHEGRVAVTGTLDEVLATEPARVTFDVLPRRGVSWLSHAPQGVSVNHRELRRPHGTRYEVQVTGTAPLHDLRWVLDAADRADVEIERLRANPASLEEVFHRVRLATPDETQMNNSDENSEALA